MATRWAMVIIMTGSIAGCATVEVPATAPVPGMANPELAMRESFKEVDAEMSELGRMGPGTAPRPMPAVVPGELDRVVAFEWHGPLDGAVEKLARSIGYGVTIRPSAGGADAPIAINTGPRRIYDIFAEIGDAAGSHATVQLDPLHHMVEVIHHA